MTTPTLEACIAEAIAYGIAKTPNGDLPEWMQLHALGRDMTPLGELAAPAVVAVVGEVLTDLRERLSRAVTDLHNQSVNARTDGQSARLRMKADGVRLALSYLDEAMAEAGR